ncbi:MAG: hypothetical protein F6K40_00295 [Okeania sp. SIO3I5]|uniref:hypothetical protein n=1 Tax=Okeania sp. SIO3I5 TaxID=2607805 RepID=UPI0013BC9F5F|nr:hypothetical protein [Okeania sp. SIO3I5]NEQ34832.1 hypothetical protein [Okeania sp. SIO3I5]
MSLKKSQQKKLEETSHISSANGKNGYKSNSLVKIETEIETVNTTSQPLEEEQNNNSEIELEENSQQSTETQPKKGKKNYWLWQLIWWTIAASFGITGGAALMWLLVNPPQPNCEQISRLSADGERLFCANKAAESRNLEELEKALTLVKSWPEEHPLYQLGQQMTGEWTKLIISVAYQKIRQGNLQGALDTVAKIPKDSPVYGRVEDAVADWKKQWAEGQSFYDKATKAIKGMNWNKASDYSLAMSKLDNLHWQTTKYRELLERIALEKNAWQILKDARYLIYRETVEEYGEAIALANKIDSSLYVREKADKDMQKWGRSLIEIATERIEAKDLKGAITAIEYIPSKHKLKKEAEDLKLLGHAQAATWEKSEKGSQINNMVALIEGKAAAAQISSDSPYYQQAQTQFKQLQQQLDNLTHIHLAKAIASVGQPATLQLAINQAEMVGLKEPKRIQAQTLIAKWRKDILKIEDRPYVTLAKQLAKQETVDSYNLAIKQASYVALERPLRIEAQTLIAEWNKRVQIIEDSPLLAEARALAKEGKLSQAIDVGYQIEKGRALYEEAQDEIYKWNTELQIVQDRPILNQAYSLAKQGSLTAAINTAYQIGYGRALYYEAQDAISRWASERDAIWAAQQAEEARREREYQRRLREQQRYYSPAPSPEYYSPAPQRSYSPAPSPQYYSPAPQRSYSPAPSPQYYSPAPQRSYSPAPAPAPSSSDAYLLQE